MLLVMCIKTYSLQKLTAKTILVPNIAIIFLVGCNYR